MDQIVLGLRFAASALFFVMLLNLARDPGPSTWLSRLRRGAWGCMAFAIVFGWSPIGVARSLGHPTPREDLMRLGAMIFTVSAALLWSAARGLSQGGTVRQVLGGAVLNLAVVALCLLVAVRLT